MNELKPAFDTIKTADGLDYFYCKYTVENEKGLLVIAHGLGEHSGRYDHVVRILAPLGLSVWAPDHRGHGKTGGNRGHVDRFSDYITDLRELFKLAVDRHEPEKLFLLGHSMGGLIAANFAISYKNLLNGLVLSSPGLGVSADIPAFKKILGNVMSALWPKLSLSNELDAQMISHDPDVVRAYMDDPLVHDRVTARWYTEFMSAMERANTMVGEISTPVLMQIAGSDRLVDPETSVDFFNRLSVEDKTLKHYETLYHEIYNESAVDREIVLNDLKEWFAARLG